MRRFEPHPTRRPHGPTGPSPLSSVSIPESPHLAPVPSNTPSYGFRERTAEAAAGWRTVIILATAAFGGLCFGYQTAVMSGLLGTPYFVQLYTHVQYHYTAKLPTDLDATGFGLPPTTKALMTATLAAGVMIGALLSGDFADYRGRRDPIIWGCILLCVGNAMQMAAEHGQSLFIVGRLVSGLGIGGISAVLILYISEVAPREWRGFSVAGYQLSISVGICLANAIVTKTEMMDNQLAYYIPISVLFSFATFLGCGVYYMPESPRWYIKQGFRDNAVAALTKIRGHDANSQLIMGEIDEMQRVCDYEQDMMAGRTVGFWRSWTLCFHGSIGDRTSNVRRTIIGIGVQMMQQLTGVNFVFYFGTTFFQQIGGVPMAFHMTLIVGCVNIAATLLSFVAVSRLGRRKLLLWGAAGMCVSQFTLGMLGTLGERRAAGTENDNDNGKATPPYPMSLMLTLINLTIFIFALTWGPVAWIVIGECFPLHLRARGVGLSAATNWFFNFSLAMATPHLVGPGSNTANLGLLIFFVLGSFCILAFAFSYCLVPEMHNLSLEEIPQMMEEVSSRKSAGWKDMRIKRPGTAAGGDEMLCGVHVTTIELDDVSAPPRAQGRMSP